MSRQPDRREAAQRAEVRAAVALLVSTAAAIGLGAVYIAGGQPQLEGVLVFVAFGGIAYALVTWANHLLGPGEATGPREHHAGTEAERAAVDEDLEEGLGRRPVLGRLLALAGAAIGAALIFPARSLGPRPGRSLKETPWRAGLRLVTEDGTVVRADAVPVDGLVTVFPEGAPGSADGQAVLVRVANELVRAQEGREDWAPQGFLAFSKQCTHAGCPVGLYQAQTHQLLCPCHQSTFDVLDGARPVFGPAAAPLPQLPLEIVDGVLIARGDFSGPVGPSFWSRQ